MLLIFAGGRGTCAKGRVMGCSLDPTAHRGLNGWASATLGHRHARKKNRPRLRSANAGGHREKPRCILQKKVGHRAKSRGR